MSNLETQHQEGDNKGESEVNPTSEEIEEPVEREEVLDNDLQRVSSESCEIDFQGLHLKLQSRMFDAVQLSNVGLQLYRLLSKERKHNGGSNLGVG